MRIAGAARLIAHQAAWRGTGMRAAGRALVRALDSPDPDLRTMAGMFLVQAGERSVPLLIEAVAHREGLPTALSVLADIGDPRAQAVIGGFVSDPDPAVADAASEALRVLATGNAQTLP